MESAALQTSPDDPLEVRVSQEALLVVAPTHGTLIGTAPDWIYVPEPGYVGSDSFSYVTSLSGVSSVNIRISSIGARPAPTSCLAAEFSPPTTFPANLQIAGYYTTSPTDIASRSIEAFTRLLDELNGQGNVVMIQYYTQPLLNILDSSLNADTLFTQKLALAKARGFRVVIEPMGVFFEYNPTTFFRMDRLSPTHTADWAHLKSLIGSNSDIIAAFYPVDEPQWGGFGGGVSQAVVKANLEAAYAEIKADYPNIPIAYIEAFPMVNASLQIPSNADWVGMDCYGSFDNCGMDGYPRRSIPEYYSILKTKLLPHQRFVVVPGAWLPPGSAPTRAQMDETASVAKQFLNWAATEPLIVAIAPFLYSASRTDVGYGARDMCPVRTFYKTYLQRAKARLSSRPISYPLNVSVTGSGSLSTPIMQGTCEGTCSLNLVQGTQVPIIATPASGYMFAGWSGDCSGMGSCTVTMNGMRTVGARFVPSSYALQVAVTGSGTVSSVPSAISNCSTSCTANVATGTTVTLFPTAGSGYSFSGWSGACTGQGSCQVTMTALRSVTATFTQNSSTSNPLTVTVTGNGSVSSSPSGINSCSSSCTSTFMSNQVVTLTPTAGSGFSFDHWGGACSGSGSCAVSMNAARTVTATFVSNTVSTSFSLDVNITGSGRVSFSQGISDCSSNCSRSFESGTSTTLTATPATGFQFDGWSGPCSGTGTCTVTMSRARSVGAIFSATASGNDYSLGGSVSGTPFSLNVTGSYRISTLHWSNRTTSQVCVYAVSLINGTYWVYYGQSANDWRPYSPALNFCPLQANAQTASGNIFRGDVSGVPGAPGAPVYVGYGVGSEPVNEMLNQRRYTQIGAIPLLSTTPVLTGLVAGTLSKLDVSFTYRISDDDWVNKHLAGGQRVCLYAVVRIGGTYFVHSGGTTWTPYSGSASFCPTPAGVQQSSPTIFSGDVTNVPGIAGSPVFIGYGIGTNAVSEMMTAGRYAQIGTVPTATPPLSTTDYTLSGSVAGPINNVTVSGIYRVASKHWQDYLDNPTNNDKRLCLYVATFFGGQYWIYYGFNDWRPYEPGTNPCQTPITIQQGSGTVFQGDLSTTPGIRGAPVFGGYGIGVNSVDEMISSHRYVQIGNVP